jgi:hypothetical protein
MIPWVDINFRRTLWPWRWKQNDTPKYFHLPSKAGSITKQKTSVWTLQLNGEYRNDNKLIRNSWKYLDSWSTWWFHILKYLLSDALNACKPVQSVSWIVWFHRWKSIFGEHFDPEDGIKMTLRNTVTYLQKRAVLQNRKPQSEHYN